MIEKDLKRIFNNILESNIVFSNEFEFQFFIAEKLKHLGCVENVYFEVVSFEKNWNVVSNNLSDISKQKKQYTDLILKLRKKNEYIAIELKYKAINKTYLYGNTLLSAQGAYDIGAYSFIKDIQRIAELKYCKRFLVNNKRVVAGFAIMLTNDYNYRSNDLTGGKGSWSNFSIKDNSMLNNKELCFLVDRKPVDSLYGKYKKLNLSFLPKGIKLNWFPQNYTHIKKKTPDFHYLIVKV